MFQRIIKTQLTNADDKIINPVSAFTRFGCWPLGPGGLLAGIRFLFAALIFVTMLVDYGLIDLLARHKREAADGDLVWFFFRPQDILHLCVLIMLCLSVSAYFFKRIDSETDTRNPRTYLAIWNFLIILIPLTASGLIMYYHVLWWNASSDGAFEATVIETFVICVFELLWGAYPADWIDVVLPVLISLVFIAYTLIMSKVFNVDLYVQLDWARQPQLAAANAALFFIVVMICSLFSTFFAIARNNLFARTTASASYLPVGESRPLKA